MMAESSAVNSAPMRIETTNGSPYSSKLISVTPPSTQWTARPRVSAAAVRAPMPAKAICPSESCPAQPVSTVSDSAQTAKAAIVA